jgi:hypothetical protein
VGEGDELQRGPTAGAIHGSFSSGHVRILATRIYHLLTRARCTRGADHLPSAVPRSGRYDEDGRGIACGQAPSRGACPDRGTGDEAGTCATPRTSPAGHVPVRHAQIQGKRDRGPTGRARRSRPAGTSSRGRGHTGATPRATQRAGASASLTTSLRPSTTL